MNRPPRSLQSRRVTTFAAVTGAMPKLGVVIVAILAAAALLAQTPRSRAPAMLGALVLAPVLLLVDIWNSPQLAVVHRHPLLALAGAVVALAVVLALAWLIFRRPALLAPLVVLALPFRVPIQAGGTTSNLLVPLYLVVAAGTLAAIAMNLKGQARPPLSRFQRWVPRLLALYVVLYGIQSVYSADFEKALQQMAFFYVPFALLFVLLVSLEWTPSLLRGCLHVLIALALLFALVGFIEYATKTIFLNPKLVAANEVHAYFTVNSVFFDPDIFGRFLAIVMIIVAGPLLFGRNPRQQIEISGILAVLWAALVLTLSRSSLAALLVGLGTLAALRWRMRQVAVVAAALVVAGVIAVTVSPNTFGLNQGANGASSGRASLISGGIDLFAQRPVWGYGSGSFSTEYSRQHPGTTKTLSASHAIPVTIAAEQGLIGELSYVALVLVAAGVMLAGARGDPARAVVGAAFLALVFHTLLYADFLEDPAAWTLLGVGTALAAGRPATAAARRRVSDEPAPVPAQRRHPAPSV